MRSAHELADGAGRGCRRAAATTASSRLIFGVPDRHAAALPIAIESVTEWIPPSIPVVVDKWLARSSPPHGVARWRDYLRPPLWIHTRMPEVDVAGHRTTRVDLSPLEDLVKKLDFDLTDDWRDRLNALRSPFSGDLKVLTALGLQLGKGDDGSGQTRRALRVTRIVAVELSNEILVSARHRDGFIFLSSRPPSDRDTFRRTALRKADVFRTSSLRQNISSRYAVDEDTTAQVIAHRLLLNVAAALPRLAQQCAELVSDAETAYAKAAVDGDEHGKDVRMLLDLVTALGHAEGLLEDARGNLAQRAEVLADSGSLTEVLKRPDRAAQDMRRLRSDARAAVDTVASAIASQQLRISREEAHAAQQDRDRREEAERVEARARDRLARDATLLASVLLVPTLVAALFSANVKLPRQGTTLGTALMFAVIVAGGFGTYGLIRWRDADPARTRAARWRPFMIAALALVAAVIIASPLAGATRHNAPLQTISVPTATLRRGSADLVLDVRQQVDACPCQLTAEVLRASNSGHLLALQRSTARGLRTGTATLLLRLPLGAARDALTLSVAVHGRSDSLEQQWSGLLR
jgi:hypothetical protein